MSFKQYQVNFDENGDIASMQELPNEDAPRKRSITVRAETERQARRLARELYTLAE